MASVTEAHRETARKYWEYNGTAKHAQSEEALAELLAAAIETALRAAGRVAWEHENRQEYP